MVISTKTPAKAANDSMKLHPSVGDSVKLTNLTHPMESFMSKVVPARLISKPATHITSLSRGILQLQRPNATVGQTITSDALEVLEKI
ncbi:hypothetical protein ACTXT7_000531 [Hymenolepis weldensis]